MMFDSAADSFVMENLIEDQITLRFRRPRNFVQRRELENGIEQHKLGPSGCDDRCVFDLSCSVTAHFVSDVWLANHGGERLSTVLTEM
jgi:hypothetical protein